MIPDTRWDLEAAFSDVIRDELTTPFVCIWIDEEALVLSLTCLNKNNKDLQEIINSQFTKLKKYMKEAWNIKTVLKECKEVYKNSSSIEIRYEIKFKMTTHLLNNLGVLLRLKGYSN